MGDGDEWITLGEAAKRLGVTRAAVYGRASRGTLQTKARGNRGLLISWPPPNEPGPSPQRHGDGNGDDQGDVTATVTGDGNGDGALVAELRSRIAALEAEREALLEAGDHLVDQLGEARERAARLEGEAEGKVQIINELRQALDHERARADRLEAELRRPWWRRWIGI